MCDGLPFYLMKVITEDEELSSRQTTVRPSPPVHRQLWLLSLLVFVFVFVLVLSPTGRYSYSIQVLDCTTPTWSAHCPGFEFRSATQTEGRGGKTPCEVPFRCVGPLQRCHGPAAIEYEYRTLFRLSFPIRFLGHPVL